METPQLKLPEEPVNPEEPWDDDALGRKSCAKTLTKFLENQNAALTISVNGAWGTGKTFFLSRWAQQLKNDGSTVIYFNAWKDDNLDDPLVAIVGQLWRELKGGTFKEFCHACKDAAGPVLKKAGLGVLKRSLEVLGVHVASIIENDLKTGTESAFDEYSELVDAKENFRERLRELAAKVFVETQKPLVFIVDELDRCRPNFAIEVLERIKHLFDIEHVVFVLGIDREQLGHAIRSVYGNIDVENYLHRFIDIDFGLPKINHTQFFHTLWRKHEMPRCLASRVEAQHCSSRFLGSSVVSDAESATSCLKDIFDLHRFSLREVEHGMKLYCLVMKSSPPDERILPELLPVLVLLKIRKKNLYTRFLNLECSLEEVVNFIFPNQIARTSENYGGKLRILSAVFSIFRHSSPYVESKLGDKIIQELKNGVTDGDNCIFNLISDQNSREDFYKTITFSSGLNFTQTELASLAQRMDLVVDSRMGTNV